VLGRESVQMQRTGGVSITVCGILNCTGRIRFIC
jgi:hypothetical protein